MVMKATKVLIDGKYKARCVEHFPEGSTSYLFSHFVVVYVGSKERTVVAASRVTFS